MGRMWLYRGRISTLLDRIAHVCITTAHARRSGRSAKLEINKPSTSMLVRSLDEKLTVCLSPILHSALIFAHAQFYLRGCLLARKETGNWVSTLTMWQSIVGSMFEKLEESSIFSVLYQPASASMKSARDISVMSTNLDARRTQQVSFMLLFSCLWPLMGSIQYVNNMIKLKAHSRVCVCMLAAVACMNGRDDDDDHVYNFVHCGWKCCKMDPSVILNEYSSWLKLLLVTVHA